MTWEAAVRWLREQPDRGDIVAACYYDDPVDAAARRFARGEEWRAVLRLLGARAAGRVLDVGAGRGISSFALAEAGYAVTALEPDPSPLVGAGAIRHLSALTGAAISVVEEWGESLPFPDGTFDLVYGRAVLHQARNLGEFCREAARVVKVGGRVLFTREHVISRHGDLQPFLEAHPLHALYGGEHAYLLSEYLEALRSAGLTVRAVLTPLQSPINHFPMTEAQVADLVRPGLVNRLGSALGVRVARSKTVQRLWTRHLDRALDTPGRLYSFLATRD
jgi:SAM-dependent methyltransferase